MREFTGAYVVRYGWTRAGVTWFAATALFIGVCFLPYVESPDLDHIALVFSPFALWTAAVCSSRRKAIRVDKQGITLYRLLPFRDRQFVSWAEVVAVDWSGERHIWGRASSVTVFRRTAATVVAARPSAPGLEEFDAYLATQVDSEFLETFRGAVTMSRRTTLCTIDPVRLATELAGLAPGVRHFGDLGDLALNR